MIKGYEQVWKFLWNAIFFISSFFLLEIKSDAQSNNIDRGYAEINGTKIYYEIIGTGDPMILIHGSFGDRRHWDFQFNEFGKKYKTIRYDIRGYGKSALPDTTIAYKDAEDLKALMDFLGISKAHLCGLSLGSIIAIDFALAYPEHCSSLILAGARVAGDSSPEYKTAIGDSVSACIRKAVDIVRNNGTKEGTDYLWSGHNPLSQAVTSPKTREALLQMGYEYSWWRYLHANKRELAFPMAIKTVNEIKHPVLIVTAEHDLELCKNIAEILAGIIPGSQLVSIKNAGHMMNMDQPKKFNKVVFRFIR